MRRCGQALACLVAALAAAQTVSGQVNNVKEGQRTLPTLTAGEPCPITVGRTGRVPPSPHIFGGPVWHGEGPVYVGFLWARGEARFSLTPIPIEHGMRRAKTAWVAAPGYAGPIEIRGRSLRPDGQPLLFDSAGSEPIERTTLIAPHVMLDAGWFDAAGRRTSPPASDRPHWSFWPGSMFIPRAGCYAIEIATPQRTQFVVFEVF